jgi:iron complex outermembrane receptor protein
MTTRRKRFFVLFSLATASLITGNSGYAENSGSGEIEELIVTSRSGKSLGAIANTVTLIDQQDLSEQIMINNDLSTILGNLVPSFSPSRQKMTSFGESLRGRNPLYLIDGVPQSNPLRDGSRDGHTIDPLMLERVEVIHGANAIHGVGAAGGIINLITRKPTKEWQQSFRIDAVGQPEESGDASGTGLNYTVSGAVDGFDVLANISYQESGINYDADGEIIGFDNAQGDTMDTDQLNVFLKSGYNWDDQRVELSINHFDLTGNNGWLGVNGNVSAGIATTAVRADVLGEAVSNEVTMLNFTYSNAEIFGHSLNLQLFDQDFAGTYGGGSFGVFQDPAFGANVFDQSQNNSNKRGLKLTLVKDQVADLPVNLVYGVDYLEDDTFQELILTGRNWVPESSFQNLSLFTQAEYTGIENLSVTAGVRVEKAELEVDSFTTLASYNGGQLVAGGAPDFNESLFNLGVTYELTSQWRLFGSYAEGFAIPDVGRVLRGINIPDQNVATFLDLDPIITDNLEVGAEYQLDNFRAQLSVYQSDSDLGQRLQANADGIFSVQREQTEIEGVEFVADWTLTSSDTLGLRYAYTQGEFDSNDDGQVDTDLDGANMAPNRLNLSWNKAWTSSLNTRLQLNAVLDRNFENSVGQQVAEFDGYTTIDFSGEYASSVGLFRLGIQNLTNTDYFTYFSQTVGSNSRNFSGIGRSLTASYYIQF